MGEQEIWLLLHSLQTKNERLIPACTGRRPYWPSGGGEMTPWVCVMLRSAEKSDTVASAISKGRPKNFSENWFQRSSP